MIQSKLHSCGVRNQSCAPFRACPNSNWSTTFSFRQQFPDLQIRSASSTDSCLQPRGEQPNFDDEVEEIYIVRDTARTARIGLCGAEDVWVHSLVGAHEQLSLCPFMKWDKRHLPDRG